ncbi:hypothetical protein [Roseibium litorale]|uniref:Uncharacterized protein n=1 Tax=Roseibium litorale TaxID=2803841 RepID=A0ABR9CMG5_9HYPH|nr:hypothetical protein [Roseibium litorale]MBD8892054.1 hypothetical protein [Roseibium litorale]
MTPSLSEFHLGGLTGHFYALQLLYFTKQLLPAVMQSVYEFAASASIAVAFHRYALLGERPNRLHFKFRRREIKFTGKLLVLSAIPAAFIVLRVMAIMMMEDIELVFTVGDPLRLAVSFLIAPLLLRAALALPASAIDHPIGFRAAYNYGKGLGLPMFGATLVLLIPVFLTNYALPRSVSLLDQGSATVFPQIKTMLLPPVLLVVKCLVTTAVITAAYRIAAERLRPTNVSL